MAIRSGLDGQFGMVAESTYGTYVAPTRFLEIADESLDLVQENIESAGIRASTRVLRSDRYARNAKGAAGSTSFEVHSKGFGLLLKHSLGQNTISTPGGGTNTRDHTCVLADPHGLMCTVQIGRPDVSGTVQPFSYLGGKVTGFEFSNDVDGALMLSTDWDFQSVTTAQSLATASFAASTELLYYSGGTVTVGGSSVNVKDISIKVDTGLDTERYFIRNSTSKLEPEIAKLAEIEGEMTVEFTDLTQYARVTGSTAAVVALWEGSTIETTFKYGVQITLQACRFDEGTVNLKGPEILEQKLKFKALYDGTNPPISVRYRTTDTTA